MTHALFKQIDLTAKLGQDGSSLQAMNALRVIRETVAKHLAGAEGAEEHPLERAVLALRTIAEFPCPEQDNMPAANMRQIALAALSGAGVSSEPGNPGGKPVSGQGNAGERPHPALGSGDSELAESLQTLVRWLDRVAIEDGYVGVPVIEAVEVVVTEMKRQQQPVDPAFCRCNHWFAGDSVEAAFIRQHGQCQDCVEMDQILEREVQAENAKRYLWLRNTALYASDLALEVNRMDKSVVNLLPRDKDGNLLAEADLDEAIDAAMAKWSAEVLCAGVDVATDRVELTIHNWTAPPEGGDA
ncbi:TPA: hypothetical protein NOS95_000108 [Pseudomonas aeruginosa]|uniref:hypothetical protein n=1 Tax=Pseudomonas aeruginosa TaxID=287 RepID=UPI00089288B9|nr:hypothetical protein [Pseudomonas aeruginosa]AOX38024.1 hypothetical protein PA11803_06321 [Pseudomonas aeruginosa]AOX38087.1 hypothetical protein PA11803_06633 [Pseudomonas aeruginosa]AWZ83903.1 hypothetical protein CSC41_2569 [Pseudomonas aeruginosa]EKF7418933.1 hypothetical protein [Pseudomonas aeruginosa]MBG4301393.1 hypothetical protein [Pseudomonas aeruginosa]